METVTVKQNHRMLRVLGAFAAVCGLFLLLAKWSREGAKPPAATIQQHIFGNLTWGDTLILSATFSECGEWGGHRERVMVYLPREDKQPVKPFEEWQQGPFTAIWLLDTIGCSKPNRTFFVAGQRLITVGDEKQIAAYLQALQTRSLDAIRPAQSGNVFRAEVSDELQIRYYDTREGWHDFEALRNHLFHK